MENSNYRISQPISLSGVHDVTICAYSISGGPCSCIDLVDCSNIHITQCELVNSDQTGIKLTGCSNILIDDCYVANVCSGIHSLNGVNIQVKNNKIKKLAPNGVLVRFECTGTETANLSSCAIVNN
jgi:parallel beta-helix repeat protein